MIVKEFGTEHEKMVAMFQCAAEPGWVFIPSAEALARDYHVILFIADGHDELGTTFVSVEKYADDATAWLKEKGIGHLDCLYGVSMGGSTVIRFLATRSITADKAIIDAGITPYPYPKLVCRLISLKDWTMIMLGTKSYTFMKLAMPPERWTPVSDDPEEHYRKIFEFEKHYFSSKTIYNVFWSANNYSMPDPVPRVDTEIEYWYGEEEKKNRKENLAYTIRAFPQTVPKEFKGLAHAELVLMFPERFREEVRRFVETDNRGTVMNTKKGQNMNTAKELMQKKLVFKAEMDRILPKEQSDALWRQATEKLDGMLNEHKSLVKGVRIHTNKIFSAAATYLTLKDVIGQEKGYRVIEDVAISNCAKIAEKLKKVIKIPGMRDLFFKAWDPMVKKLFGPGNGFQNVFYPDKKGEYRMDVISCPYCRYFTEAGCPELTKIFCENDDRIYGNLPGLKFERTGTLGKGAERCDFCLRKM